MASYHFLCGSTARLAGTEYGVDEPRPTFSACFGASFVPRDPVVYATMLAERLRSCPTECWRVNTGWSGAPYRQGKRMRISLTRDLLKAALEGSLEHVEATPHPVFGVLVPRLCPRVPSKMLDPQSTWADENEYDARAAEVARHFAANLARFADRLPAEVAAAGPHA